MRCIFRDQLQTRSILALSLLFGSVTIAHATFPENYQSLSGQEKLNLLWNELDKPHSLKDLPSSPPGLYDFVSGVCPHNAAKAFTRESDLRPTGDKPIHTHGSVARVKWVASGISHPFTGVFKGAEKGLLRVAPAKVG